MPRTKYAIPLVLLTLLALFGFTQDGPLEPVKWTISSSQADDEHAELKFHADVDEGWYVYSSISFGDMGPIPTTIELDSAGSAEAVGEIVEMGEKVLEGFDPLFDMNVKKFKGWADYIQKVKLNDPTKPITGRLDFMTCNDKECIFPDPLYFKVDPVSGSVMTDGIPFSADEEAVTGLPGSNEEILEPVTWELNTKELEDGTYEFNAVAHVQEGWYIYSQTEFGIGPMPTVVRFDTLDHFSIEGDATESGRKMVEGMDPVFEVHVRKYKKEATFTRVLKVSDPSKDISGTIDFMTCNDEACIFPDPLPFKLNIANGTSTLGLVDSDLQVSDKSYKLENVDLENPVLSAADGGENLRSTKGASSLWKLFFLGFIGGLVALLTPCVFPMIPLTVSFFTKGSEDKAKGTRRAITYGAFIFLIYVVFSIPFHVAGSVNPEIFNEISTNPWLNIFFFVIFIVFAISFFGYFEITLPSSFVNKMDSNANKYGGLVGIFFMALTLALVSFSCTGPILGSLLAGAITSTGGAMQLTMGLAGFGLALALPFALFAMFPRWLNSLPSSGGWLNSVKVVLGFAEIALAFKFLSNADLVMHWGLIRYEVFMAVWILCALGIVIYLLGKIRFPHDSPLQTITPMRWTFTALFGIAAIYLMGGFRYMEENKTFTPLSLMSGLAPPVGYSWIYPKECPSNLNCYKDLDEGLAAAKEQGKPVMLDFTGYACVNCRKMEEHVWPEQPVYDLINDNYILISLYVDDKAELPEDQQHVYETTQGKRKQIITKGNKWSTIQTETFVNNSQPYYALLSPDGQLLTDPVPYTPDVNEYADFLQRGITAMQQVAVK